MKTRRKSRGGYDRYFSTQNIRDMNYQTARRYELILEREDQQYQTTIVKSQRLLFQQDEKETRKSDQQRCNGIPKDDVVQEHFLHHDDSVGVALEQSALQQDYVFQFDDVSARSTQSNNQKESAVQIEVRLTNDGKFYEPCDTMANLIQELIVAQSSDKSTNSKDSLLYPKNYDSLKSDTKLVKKVCVSVNTSVGEILVMALKYAEHFKSSVTGLTSLLRFANNILRQQVVFDTKYMIDKIFNPKNNAHFHAVCPKCKLYVGELCSLESSATCESCGANIDLSISSCDNIFVLIDPTDAIEDLLSQHIDYYNYIVKERVQEKGVISDIYDGKRYRNFVQQLPTNEKDYYLTATFNTDGASKFESSKNSIWPIYLKINEIPPQARLNNLIVCGIYFGKEKPEMTSYLDPFVSIMNKYSSEGIKCNIKGHSRIFKLYAICACVDAVARAPMQGIKQFNGHYGCNWCLHPGVYAGGSMRYPLIVPAPCMRTRENMVKVLNQMIQKDFKSKDGVLYGSPLLNLTKFDAAAGFVPDPMHCLTGVAKQIANTILDTLTEDQLNRMNLVLEKIKVPTKLGRLTRPLDDRENWKAREWENFILYYSIPLFSLVLNEERLKYWSCFVESVHILNQDSISIINIQKAKLLLVEFCFKTQEWFSKIAMTYNIHQLLHLVDSVLDWGPLWAHSAYAFEAANNDLLQAIHSANGVIHQIVRYVNIRRYTNILYNHIYQDCSDVVKNFCDHINNTYLLNGLKIGGTSYLGEGNSVPPITLMKLGLKDETTLEYSRIVKNSCLYTSNKIVNDRSANYYAQLQDGRFIEIVSFIVDPESNKERILYKLLKTKPLPTSTFIHEISHICTEIRVKSTEKLGKICISIITKKIQYIIPVPNMLSY